MAQQPRAQLSQGTLPMQELPGPSSQVLNASLTCRLRGDTEGAGNPKTRTHFPPRKTLQVVRARQRVRRQMLLTLLPI